MNNQKLTAIALLLGVSLAEVAELQSKSEEGLLTEEQVLMELEHMASLQENAQIEEDMDILDKQNFDFREFPSTEEYLLEEEMDKYHEDDEAMDNDLLLSLEQQAEGGSMSSDSDSSSSESASSISSGSSDEDLQLHHEDDSEWVTDNEDLGFDEADLMFAEDEMIQFSKAKDVAEDDAEDDVDAEDDAEAEEKEDDEDDKEDEDDEDEDDEEDEEDEDDEEDEEEDEDDDDDEKDDTTPQNDEEDEKEAKDLEKAEKEVAKDEEPEEAKEESKADEKESKEAPEKKEDKKEEKKEAKSIVQRASNSDAEESNSYSDDSQSESDQDSMIDDFDNLELAEEVDSFEQADEECDYGDDKDEEGCSAPDNNLVQLADNELGTPTINSLAEDGPKEIQNQYNAFMKKCKSNGYCTKACTAQWKMKQQYAHYKMTMKAEYASYKASVNAANAAIRSCPRKAAPVAKKVRKPPPPKAPPVNKKAVARKNGGTWSYSYWMKWMKTCEGQGMCKYACGAKYNMLMYKDQYRQVHAVAMQTQKTYSNKFNAMKKQTGAAYKSARKALEPYKQRNIKAQAKSKKTLGKVKKYEKNYKNAMKYCSYKNKYQVKKRTGGGSWSWNTRKSWINKNLKSCGCQKVCAAKWNYLRLKDYVKNQKDYELKLANQVKDGWAELKKIQGDASKRARAALEPLRKRQQIATKNKNQGVKQLNKAKKFYDSVRKAGCYKKKTTTKSVTKYTGGKSGGKSGGQSYKWSWAWYLSRYCPAYKKAQNNQASALKKYYAANSALQKASKQVNKMWAEYKKLGTKQDKKTYINAKSTQYSKLNGSERGCAKACADDAKCELYLMSSSKSCHLFKNVSGVTTYDKPGGAGPSHAWWGKTKKEITKFMNQMDKLKSKRAKATTQRVNAIKAYKQAAAKTNQAQKACHGSYYKSSWYSKWRTYTSGGKWRSGGGQKSGGSSYKYTRKWSSGWNQKWITSWTTGNWGWNKYEWAKYDKKCKSSGLCERGCAAKYKVEKITQKHDDTKKIFESLHKSVLENKKAAKGLKGAEATKANGEVAAYKAKEQLILKQRQKMFAALKQAKKDFRKIKNKCPSDKSVVEAKATQKTGTVKIATADKKIQDAKVAIAKTTDTTVIKKLTTEIKSAKQEKKNATYIVKNASKTIYKWKSGGLKGSSSSYSGGSSWKYSGGGSKGGYKSKGGCYGCQKAYDNYIKKCMKNGKSDKKWSTCDAKYHKLKFGKTSLTQQSMKSETTPVDPPAQEVSLGKNNQNSVTEAFKDSNSTKSSTNSTSLMSTYIPSLYENEHQKQAVSADDLLQNQYESENPQYFFKSATSHQKSKKSKKVATQALITLDRPSQFFAYDNKYKAAVKY